MSKRFEVVVIGGGQAGLTMSYVLKQNGVDHIVLERNRIAESWRSGRWDSFTLVSPNWTVQLPGYEYSGPDPDGFMPKNEVVSYLEGYARHFDAPVVTGVEVLSVEPLENGSGYSMATSDGDYEAQSVVVATGLFQKPKLPNFSADLPPDLVQMHTGQFRNEEALPPGAVLVIGSGQSGCQVAEELHESGRKVYLSVGSAGRVVRKYRGKDSFWWLRNIGFFSTPLDKMPSPMVRYAGHPHLSGKAGGHSIYLRRFAREGMTLLGRVQGARDGKVLVAENLNETLGKVDGVSANVLKSWDEYAAKTGLEFPEDEEVRAAEAEGGPGLPETSDLDLKAAGVSTVIWAGGYSFDFSWIHLPVLDEHGYPVQEQGVSAFDGLYFLGLHFLHTRGSGLFLGVGGDAQHVAEHLLARRAATR